MNKVSIMYLVYFDEKGNELWEEEVDEKTRVPCIGESVYIKDAETDCTNAKSDEYIARNYKVMNVETCILINRGYNNYGTQYSVILKEI